MKKRLQDYSLWVFDLDGTLIDSSTDIANSVNELRANIYLKELPREEIAGNIGRGITHLLTLSIPEKRGEIKPLVHKFQDIYSKKLLEKTCLKPGVKDFLELLHNGKKIITIFTNKPEEFSLQIIKGLGIENIIQYLIGGDTLNILKPEPDGLSFLISKFNIQKEKSIMAGDTDIDIKTAQNAGIDSVYIGEKILPIQASFNFITFKELFKAFLDEI